MGKERNLKRERHPAGFQAESWTVGFQHLRKLTMPRREEAVVRSQTETKNAGEARTVPIGV